MGGRPSHDAYCPAVWLCLARLTEATDTLQLLLRKALPPPLARSQAARVLCMTQHSAPFVFPCLGFSWEVLSRWGRWYPWPGGPTFQTCAIPKLGFPQAVFSLPAGYQGPKHPKELWPDIAAPQKDLHGRSQRGRHVGILTSRARDDVGNGCVPRPLHFQKVRMQPNYNIALCLKIRAKAGPIGSKRWGGVS